MESAIVAPLWWTRGCAGVIDEENNRNVGGGVHGGRGMRSGRACDRGTAPRPWPRCGGRADARESSMKRTIVTLAVAFTAGGACAPVAHAIEYRLEAGLAA